MSGSRHRTSSTRRSVDSQSFTNVDDEAVAADGNTPLPSPRFHPHMPGADLTNQRNPSFNREIDLISRRLSFSNLEDSPIPSKAKEISENAMLRYSKPNWRRVGDLGSGSSGTVIKAMHADGSFFAVKKVSFLDQGEQCIRSLQQEIEFLSRFKHRNLIQFYGTDKDSSTLYIFLELATEGSLASLYQKYHLQHSQVSAYTRQILEGLNYLHSQRVIHRDIKCANILVNADGTVKLADFGVAKQISELTHAKSFQGTANWMAPEVVKTEPYGPSADIWSLGCTVLEMLTRRPPYPDLKWPQPLFKINNGELPDVPNSLSEEARDFIKRCLQFKPDDRPTAADLLKHQFVK